jgi:anti-sigma B factor antagonist
MSLSLRASALDVNHTEQEIVVRFPRHPALDAGVVEEVAGQLTRLVESQRPRTLLLDFAGVTYLSAAALGTFVALNKRLGTIGGRVVLTNLCAPLYEIFEVTRLHRVLEIRTGARQEPPCHLSTCS